MLQVCGSLLLMDVWAIAQTECDVCVVRWTEAALSDHAVCTCTYYACVLISKHSMHKLTMCLRGWDSMKRAEQVQIRSQTVINTRTSEPTERPD